MPKVGQSRITVRPQQIKILECLACARGPLTRKEIAARTGLDPSKIGDWAHRPTNQSDETKAKWPFPDLLSLRMVRVQDDLRDVGGRLLEVLVYSITDKGREQLPTKKPPGK